LIAFFKHTLQSVSLPRCFEKDLINADLINSLYLEIDSDNELKKKERKESISELFIAAICFQYATLFDNYSLLEQMVNNS
jgi:hypothetical protein